MQVNRASGPPGAPRNTTGLNRRSLLVRGGKGLGFVWLTSLTSCRLLEQLREPAVAADAGAVTVTTGGDHVVFDNEGSAYIIDALGRRLHRLDVSDRIDRSIGGLGSSAGELNGPVDAAFGADGTLIVLDRGNGRLHTFSSEGDPLMTFGEGLTRPGALLVDGDRIYVCDTLGHSVRLYGSDGILQQTFGSEQGLQFNGPRGLAIAPDGLLHVLDAGSARVHVIDAEGSLVRSYGEYGGEPGQMYRPCSIAITPSGQVMMTDPSSGFVHTFSLDGEFEDRFRPTNDAGEQRMPLRVSATPTGGLYVWIDE